MAKCNNSDTRHLRVFYGVDVQQPNADFHGRRVAWECVQGRTRTLGTARHDLYVNYSKH